MTIIQVDYSGPGEVYVHIITGDVIEPDGVFDTKREAEQRAEVLAKLYGCDWETNYS